jgi:hypothetical protein
MSRFKSLTAAGIAMFCTYLVSAQDKICVENDVFAGKVNDISLSTVRYTPAGKPNQPMLVPLHKVYILFNSDGGYLVPSQMDSTNPNIRTYLSRFFTPGPHTRTKDQVFTTQHNFIEQKILREDDEFLYWSDNSKMPKKDVAVIIYTDGYAKLLCPVEQAAQILGTCQKTPLNLGIGNDMVVTNQSTSAGTDAGGKTGADAGNPVEAAPVVQTGSASTPTNDEPDSIKSKVKALLGNVRPEEFTEKATKKTVELTGYLAILCNKSASTEDLDKAVSQAMLLFINDSAVVEISSANRNTISTKLVKDYLHHLKLIQYDKIEVKWTHVQYVSDLKPGPDGRLYGTVSFEQEFKGYKDGRLVYSDVTIKHATVILVTYQKVTEGTTQRLWDVRLGDIGVVATKT